MSVFALILLSYNLIVLLRSTNGVDVKQDFEEAMIVKLNKQFTDMSNDMLILKQSMTELRNENKILKKQVNGLQKSNGELRRTIDALKSTQCKARRPDVIVNGESFNKQHLVDSSMRYTPDSDKRRKLVQHKEKAGRIINSTIDASKGLTSEQFSNETISKYEEEENKVTQPSNNTKLVTVPTIESAWSLSKRIHGRILNPRLGRQLTERNEQVAFSAWVKNDIMGLVKDDVILFDGFLVNDGNGYDVKTGIFTAPRSGLYLLSFVIENYHDQDLWVVLNNDGYVRAHAVAEPYDSHQNTMGGNVVLLNLREGSLVWVAISRGNRVQRNCSTFSGVLLH